MQPSDWPRRVRPDLAVQVSLSQQALSDPRVRHCRQANAMVRRARQHHELMWRFLPVPLENLRLVMHSDAAFQNAQGRASQAGYIIAVTDDRLARGELAPWSPLIWRSHKMRRIVGSTLPKQNLLNCLGHAEWIAAHFAEARFPIFDVAQRSTFLRIFRLQCVGMPSRCTITWFLCHPRPVWKTNVVVLIWSFLDNACSVLVPRSDGLPLIVSWLTH